VSKESLLTDDLERADVGTRVTNPPGSVREVPGHKARIHPGAAHTRSCEARCYWIQYGYLGVSKMAVRILPSLALPIRIRDRWGPTKKWG